MNIYLICTGNTCRSPMAEAILRSKGIANVAVRSAGIHAQNGWPISSNAKMLIEELDMPYTAVSRAVSSEDLKWADIVLTMTEGHKAALIHAHPEADYKTFTLKGFVTPEIAGDVHDPYGGDIETYRQSFEELSEIIDVLEQKLMEE
ncbi:MAG TPA: low molecular weight protein arginine phosphatase [Sporosarcina psychrophila]|uniref:Low molecular weight protein arginine phosphatase n=1 Tax=Sporosarcina psychrophila TaxID=1476 RepID=A0A921KB98_SPOPS|nr:low molecular weight protein arginine phosphatase [Sporosarcina psychrophila]